MWVMGWLSPPEAYVGDNATAFAKIIVDMTRTGLYFQGQHHFAGAVSKYDPEGKLTAVSKAMRRGFWVSADLLLGPPRPADRLLPRAEQLPQRLLGGHDAALLHRQPGGQAGGDRGADARADAGQRRLPQRVRLLRARLAAGARDPPLVPARPSRKLGSQHQWGEQYPRLLEIKRRLDPQGIFLCHHCVGSEGRA